ncbi:MAG: hypothetical protein R3Y26_00205 [Rikenellaceae bacterium]
MLDNKTDLENVFTWIGIDEIAEFCKQHALVNKQLADALIAKFAGYNGDSVEERIKNIDIELDKCFMYVLNERHPREYAPHLDWSRVGHNLWALANKGELMVKKGYVIESVHLAIEMLRKISEMYIEDEVWNDTDYDGDDLSSSYAIKLLHLAINTNTLNNEEITKVHKDLKTINEMEANTNYGLMHAEIENTIQTMLKL